MNERIKELAEQALKTTMLTDAVYRPEGYANAVSKDFADKFAELIIRGCVVYIKNERKGFNPTEWDQGVDYGLKRATDVIKEHFWSIK